MTYLKDKIRYIAIGLLISFSLMDATLYAAPVIDPAVAQSLPKASIDRFVTNPAGLDIPFENVHLKEVHQGSSGKLIIHIQDAHANLGGQKNLAKALDHLMNKYDLDLVLVEGSARDASLHKVRRLASLDDWRVIANRFLFDGLISGEEYLNLTTDHPMKIVGVEYRDLYDESLKAYAALVDQREDILHYLHDAKNAVGRLKHQHYPQILIDFEDFKNKRDEFSDFTKSFMELLKLQKHTNVQLEDFVELKKLKNVYEKEKDIDYEKANNEQRKLFSELSQKGADIIVQDYIEYSRKLKYSQVSNYMLLNKIFGAAKARHISVNQFSELVEYQNYLKNFADLNLDSLLNEMELFEDEIYNDLLQTDDGKKVRAIDRFIGLLGNAHKLQMSSKEFGLMKFNEDDFPTESWLAFLNQKLAELGFFENLMPYRSHLDKAKKELNQFYTLVSDRDLAFVKNAKRIMDKEKESAAVLIAGGYHTAHLTDLLKKEDMSYIVLSPIIRDKTNHEKYEKILLANLRAEEKRLKQSINPTPFQAQGVAPTKIPRGIRTQDLVTDHTSRKSEMKEAAARLSGAFPVLLRTLRGLREANPERYQDRQNNEVVRRLESMDDGTNPFEFLTASKKPSQLLEGEVLSYRVLSRHIQRLRRFQDQPDEQLTDRRKWLLDVYHSLNFYEERIGDASVERDLSKLAIIRLIEGESLSEKLKVLREELQVMASEIGIDLNQLSVYRAYSNDIENKRLALQSLRRLRDVYKVLRDVIAYGLEDFLPQSWRNSFFNYSRGRNFEESLTSRVVSFIDAEVSGTPIDGSEQIASSSYGEELSAVRDKLIKRLEYIERLWRRPALRQKVEVRSEETLATFAEPVAAARLTARPGYMYQPSKASLVRLAILERLLPLVKYSPRLMPILMVWLLSAAELNAQQNYVEVDDREWVMDEASSLKRPLNEIFSLRDGAVVSNATVISEATGFLTSSKSFSLSPVRRGQCCAVIAHSSDSNTPIGVAHFSPWVKRGGYQFIGDSRYVREQVATFDDYLMHYYGKSGIVAEDVSVHLLYVGEFSAEPIENVLGEKSHPILAGFLRDEFQRLGYNVATYDDVSDVALGVQDFTTTGQLVSVEGTKKSKWEIISGNFDGQSRLEIYDGKPSYTNRIERDQTLVNLFVGAIGLLTALATGVYLVASVRLYRNLGVVNPNLSIWQKIKLVLEISDVDTYGVKDVVFNSFGVAQKLNDKISGNTAASEDDRGGSSVGARLSGSVEEVRRNLDRIFNEDLDPAFITGILDDAFETYRKIQGEGLPGVKQDGALSRVEQGDSEYFLVFGDNHGESDNVEALLHNHLEDILSGKAKLVSLGDVFHPGRDNLDKGYIGSVRSFTALMYLFATNPEKVQIVLGDHEDVQVLSGYQLYKDNDPQLFLQEFILREVFTPEEAERFLEVLEAVIRQLPLQVVIETEGEDVPDQIFIHSNPSSKVNSPEDVIYASDPTRTGYQPETVHFEMQWSRIYDPSLRKRFLEVFRREGKNVSPLLWSGHTHPATRDGTFPVSMIGLFENKVRVSDDGLQTVLDFQDPLTSGVIYAAAGFKSKGTGRLLEDHLGGSAFKELKLEPQTQTAPVPLPKASTGEPSKVSLRREAPTSYPRVYKDDRPVNVGNYTLEVLRVDGNKIIITHYDGNFISGVEAKILNDGDTYTIGSASSNDVTLEGLRPFHAKVELKGGKYYLVEIEKDGGAVLDDEPAGAFDPLADTVEIDVRAIAQRLSENVIIGDVLVDSYTGTELEFETYYKPEKPKPDSSAARLSQSEDKDGSRVLGSSELALSRFSEYPLLQGARFPGEFIPSDELSSESRRRIQPTLFEAAINRKEGFLPIALSDSEFAIEIIPELGAARLAQTRIQDQLTVDDSIGSSNVLLSAIDTSPSITPLSLDTKSEMRYLRTGARMAMKGILSMLKQGVGQASTVTDVAKYMKDERVLNEYLTSLVDVLSLLSDLGVDVYSRFVYETTSGEILDINDERLDLVENIAVVRSALSQFNRDISKEKKDSAAYKAWSDGTIRTIEEFSIGDVDGVRASGHGAVFTEVPVVEGEDVYVTPISYYAHQVLLSMLDFGNFDAVEDIKSSYRSLSGSDLDKKEIESLREGNVDKPLAKRSLFRPIKRLLDELNNFYKSLVSAMTAA